MVDIKTHYKTVEVWSSSAPPEPPWPQQHCMLVLSPPPNWASNHQLSCQKQQQESSCPSIWSVRLQLWTSRLDVAFRFRSITSICTSDRQALQQLQLTDLWVHRRCRTNPTTFLMHLFSAHSCLCLQRYKSLWWTLWLFLMIYKEN